MEHCGETASDRRHSRGMFVARVWLRNRPQAICEEFEGGCAEIGAARARTDRVDNRLLISPRSRCLHEALSAPFPATRRSVRLDLDRISARRAIMTTQYEGVKHVISLLSYESKNCEHCTRSVGGEHFSESINHLIKDHGYKLLHVGTETSTD